MTRFLSSALGATQPLFGQSIAALERAGGQPSADIRLSSELMQQVRLKIGELGLDPTDTTGPELYGALQGRLAADDQKVRQALSITDDASSDDMLARAYAFLKKQADASTCFAL